jgi:lipid II:glycine glycyltransferase (peptidoglycan interpeptide bridge formation enzyme)
MPELSFDEWNRFLEQYPDVHILQSGEWGELKSAFGWSALRVAVDSVGAQILFRRLPLGLTFAYIPKGPLLPPGDTDPDLLKRFWAEVGRACRARRAIFLKVEPDAWTNAAPRPVFPPGFELVPSPQHVQPACTLVIDLAGSQDEVFERMKPKTRYNIRLAGRKEVVVRATDDLQSFYHVMQVTSHRMEFHVHSFEYYRRAYELFHPQGMCELLVAEFEGRPLANVMVFARGKQAYYLYGASSDEERNRKPTYPLQWEAIRWAMGRGCTEYDMWGVPDEDEAVLEADGEEREDGLWGVYRFKKGFGGALRRAVPPVDCVYNRAMYRVYLWRSAGSGQD